ncbi:methyltransferase type 11 [Planococcus antarcticus DSM 14505]|uniref:Methyltransferase n=1 Tax=Planococcus antarcticus DSM 14505 TaxID=1185653 RepID=A0A1C7DGR1_9BACL|nr:class I SAM-dependent methyltransferase [Planococcus antarcticus]ANU10598.1 methyltransferase [Planococcus antarcticus DSM 14505]EIM06680.1 methyltransferase type 11 [Planococcus antarcticus DSM 14505]
MNFKGSSAYEEKDFLANYLQRRNRIDSPNNSIEKPVIFELLGAFKKKKILDLGCGDALFGKELLRAGADYYHGVEGSLKMGSLAEQNLEGLDARITLTTIESFEYPKESYDIVASRLAVHYLPDIEQLFKKIYHTLKTKGKFVFSVQHPLTTCSFESKNSGERRSNWIVDDYFEEGERQEPWIDKIVVKYHRTTESYFTALRKAGFIVTDLQEGMPKQQNFEDDKEFTRRKRIPVILAFSCSKQ